MLKNLNEKRKAVGRGMAKVENQKSASKVPANFAWGSGNNKLKGSDPSGNSVKGITVRGSGAQTKGKTSTGPWTGAKEGYSTKVTRTIGFKQKG